MRFSSMLVSFIALLGGGFLMRVLKCVLFVLLLAVLPLSLCPAQTATTSLRGAVHDPTGAVIPGAVVTITRPDTGFTAKSVSDAHGAYVFEQIPPGVYTIQTSVTGFATQTQSVELLVNQPATLDIKMEVSSSNLTVQVSASTATLNTSDATIGTPFNHTQIQSLSFEGNNVVDLLLLMAGVFLLA